MNINNMNPNSVKRFKKFDKEMSLYVKHPNYEEIKQLYLNNILKTITSAENMILKIKITKKGTVDKRSLPKLTKLKKLNDDLFDKLNKDKLKKFVKDMKLLNENKKSRVVVMLKEFNTTTKNSIHSLIKTLIDMTRFDKKYLLNIDKDFYVLNDNTKKRLYELCTPEAIVKGSEPISYSDSEILYELKDKIKMTISINKNKAKYKKSSGEFFKYLNKTTIDLSEYQIYNKNQFNEANHDESCLFFALSKLGLSDERKSLLKTLIKNRNIPMSDIEKICDKIQIQINVKKICNDKNRVFKYGKKYTEVYDIGLIEDHYFHIKKYDEELKKIEKLNNDMKELKEKQLKKQINKYKLIKDTRKSENHKIRIDDEEIFIYFKDGEYSGWENLNNLIEKTNKLLVENDNKYIENLKIEINYLKSKFYTTYSIQNYDKVKDIKNFNNLVNDKNERKNRFIDSFDLINLFVKNKDKLLEEMTFDNCNIADTQFYDKINDEIISLDYDEKVCCKPVKEEEEPKMIRNDNNQFVFFDFETYRDKNNMHVPYMLCATFCEVPDKPKFQSEEDVELDKLIILKTEKYIGTDCGKDFIKNLENNSILIAHNVTYDYRFIIDELTEINEISRGSKLLGCNACVYNKKNIKIKVKIMDSYHLIGQPLRNFNKIFKLDVKKEVMPYDLYNKENLIKKFVNLDECLKYVKLEEKNDFIKNVKDWNLLNKNNEVDIITYSLKYCLLDVDVLYNGYRIFRDWMFEHFDIKTENCLTIASLAHKYLINTGCYDDVYELGGVPQMFIQSCVVGGRTMTNNNEKQTFNLENDESKKMQDFDAVSLYPSAMERIDGFLKGKPKVIKNLSYEFLKEQDGYFVEIKINKVGIKRDFSLMSYKTEEGIRLFTNDIINKNIRVDKTSLEDLIEFHKIEFQVIRGYYFNDGFNNCINRSIKFIFSKRLELKKIKNPAELTYKLIMNNAYGKSIMKPIETETKLYTSHHDFEVFIERNYNWISSFNTFGKDDNKFKVKVIKKLNDHYNICHVGVNILSMSKRIMNEVMTLAEDNNLKIYYQDTDSMHIEEHNIDQLEELFNKKYHRDLIGKNMGQFHSDFSLGNCENIYASKSLFLGKKSYIDELKGTDEEGNIKTGYHIRMKGIPNSCIEYTALKEGYKNPFELYLDLYNGKEIAFDLTENGKKTNFFNFKNDYTVYTKTDFTRNIKF